MMKISFLPIAQAELDDSFDWYQEQMIGLGYDFLEAFNSTLKLIVSYPQLPPVMSGNVRRCLLNRFPYAIYLWCRRRRNCCYCCFTFTKKA